MQDKPGPGSMVVVIGCGRSGVAATRLMTRHGATVLVVDDAPRAALGAAPATVEALGATCVCGAASVSSLPAADWVVVSPGVPTERAQRIAAQTAGAPLVGEVALASWYCPAPMLVVTGTNGKTTTATLLHHMLRVAGIPAVLAGNVGTAFSGVVADVTDQSVVVLEMSSYQLDHAVNFAPRVGAILNLTPDHLDRYGSFDAYVAAKRVLWNMLATDGLAVVNADDSRVAKEAGSYEGRATWFGLAAEQPTAVTVLGGTVTASIGDARVAVLPVQDIPLLGEHNVSNVLAALACALEVCGDVSALAAGVRSFTPVEHRLESVRERDSVLYINDSKATNVSATLKALEAMTRPTVLLLGGRGKGTGYRELRPLITTRVRHLVVYGEDAERVLADVGDLAATQEAQTFADAVLAAARSATAGDVVLLSPACASFDMFTDFEARGHEFKRLVGEL